VALWYVSSALFWKVTRQFLNWGGQDEHRRSPSEKQRQRLANLDQRREDRVVELGIANSRVIGKLELHK
jgi:hypothetical protein